MLSTAYYFLQVMLCSAIMMGYYWMALRNKKFHQYNRFYLLSVALFSWTVPLVKIQWATTYTSQQQVIRFLSVVADNNSELEAVIESKGFHWSMEAVVSMVYLLTAALLFAFLIRAFYRIYDLLKKHSCKKVGDVFLVITRAKGTPFSFFRYIFWNEEIDIRSASGKQILQHELTHVRQKHSVDKLLIQVMLIPGWFNPFFWLLKKEMEMIHEFIADKKAVQDGDTAALAQMLLTAVYPKHRFDLVHPFFFSPIKRRLQMLTNHKNPRFSYIRRLVILPLLAVVIVFFAFRNKAYRAEHPISVKNVLQSVINDVKASQQSGITVTDIDLETVAPMKFSKTYRIVINPGHGGEDVGARSADGTTESVLTLQMAKMFKEKNSNPHLDIVLTRNSDEFYSIMQVAEKVNAFAPDLFVSLHINADASVLKKGARNYSSAKGAEIVLADKAKAFDYENSYVLASSIGNSIVAANTAFGGIKSKTKAIYLLQTVKCPSVLIEAGYLTNKEEAVLLKTEAYQEKIVKAILQGIEQYLSGIEKKRKFTKTDISLNKQNSNADTSKYTRNVTDKKEPLYEFGAERIVVKKDKRGNFQLIKLEGNPYFNLREKYRSLEGFLFLLDGKKISYDQLDDIDPKQIKTINVTKDPVTIKQLTNENVIGIVEIISKQKNSVSSVSGHLSSGTVDKGNNTDLNNGLMQQETPPSFPGGEVSWLKYLERSLDTGLVKRKGGPPGKYTVVLNFSVDELGRIRHIRSNNPGYGTKEEAIRMIEKGPFWKPALKNDKPVSVEHKLTITFVVNA